MKKHLSLVVLAFLLVFFYLPGQAGAQTLRLGHHHAVGGQVDQTANLFEKLVKEKSNGKLTIKVFPAAQLGQEREAFEQLNQGILRYDCHLFGAYGQILATHSSRNHAFPLAGLDTCRKGYLWKMGGGNCRRYF